MKKTIILLALFSIPFFSYSQDQWDASIPETLFLGRSVDDYLNTVTGSMYIFDDFQEGKIKFTKGDLSGPVLLNVNAYKKELNIKKTIDGSPLALDLDFIQEVIINGTDGDKFFRKLSADNFEKGKSETFLYEVLFDNDGLTLIKEEVILLSKAEKGAYASGPQEDSFISSVVYYLSNKNNPFSSTNLAKASIQKILGKEVASLIDSHFKSNGLSWKSETDIVNALSAIEVK